MLAAFDLFISHADGDRAWVQGHLLSALGLPADRVITRHDFQPGAAVVAEFERAVMHSRYTVLVLSLAYLADEWLQFGEMLSSHTSVAERRDRVIPLLLQPCELPLRVEFRVRLDCTDSKRWADEIARLRALLGQPEPPARRIPCPYPGMVPFSEADAARFFGRDREVAELVQRLRLHPFVAVIGPSGCGKSSLISAGLIPALRQSSLFGPGDWHVRTMRPGNAPPAALQAAVGDLVDLETFELTGVPEDRLLLVVDQFEELFTLEGTDTGSFQESLLRLSRLPGCYVLMSVRADFYADLMTSLLWPEVRDHLFDVLPLGADGLRQAIVKPAQHAEEPVYIDVALVERLVADAAGEPGVLPFVQETLVLLREHLERRYLPLGTYEALAWRQRDPDGRPLTGLQVAMARRADAALAQLTPEEQAIARRIFLRLVQFGEGRTDTRRQQPLSALRAEGDVLGALEETLQHLTRSRLLTASAEEEGTESRVDIAHEALITGWPTFQEWLKERREVSSQ